LKKEIQNSQLHVARISVHIAVPCHHSWDGDQFRVGKGWRKKVNCIRII